MTLWLSPQLQRSQARLILKKMPILIYHINLIQEHKNRIHSPLIFILSDYHSSYHSSVDLLPIHSSVFFLRLFSILGHAVLYRRLLIISHAFLHQSCSNCPRQNQNSSTWWRIVEFPSNGRFKKKIKPKFLNIR